MDSTLGLQRTACLAHKLDSAETSSNNTVFRRSQLTDPERQQLEIANRASTNLFCTYCAHTGNLAMCKPETTQRSSMVTRSSSGVAAVPTPSQLACLPWKDSNLASGACACAAPDHGWGQCAAKKTGNWAGFFTGRCSGGDADAWGGKQCSGSDVMIAAEREHVVSQQQTCPCAVPANASLSPTCRPVTTRQFRQGNYTAQPLCAEQVCSSEMYPEAARVVAASAFLGRIVCVSPLHWDSDCMCLFPGLSASGSSLNHVDILLRGSRIIGDSTSLQFGAALRSVVQGPSQVAALVAAQEESLHAQLENAVPFPSLNVANQLCRVPNLELHALSMRADNSPQLCGRYIDSTEERSLPCSQQWNSRVPSDPTELPRAVHEHVAVFNYGLHLLWGYVEPTRWAVNANASTCGQTPPVHANREHCAVHFCSQWPLAMCMHPLCAGCSARSKCPSNSKSANASHSNRGGSAEEPCHTALGTFPNIPGRAGRLSVVGNFSRAYPSFLGRMAQKLRKMGFSQVIFRSSNAIHDGAYTGKYRDAVRACRNRESGSCQGYIKECARINGLEFAEACRDTALDNAGSARLNCLAACHFSVHCKSSPQAHPTTQTRVCHHHDASIDGYLDMGMVSAMHPECTRQGDGRHVFALELVGVRLLRDLLLAVPNKSRDS